MPNEEHLKILESGVSQWNAWRQANPSGATTGIGPDLTGADLTRAELTQVDLTNARLSGAQLSSADLRCADLTKADLTGAILNGATLDGARLNNADLEYAGLVGAHLHGADLGFARLIGADLSKADLEGADLIKADLTGALLGNTDLRGTNLIHANLNGALLTGAKLAHARVADTIFADVDLKRAQGLVRVEHYGPSIIDRRTLALFEGDTPAGFLRGCGLLDWEIEAAKLHAAELTTDELTEITYEIHRLKGESPVQVSPLFISYARGDQAFVEVLEEELDERRVRYWRDVHDLKAGPVEKQIEQAIRHNPTVLLVLSEQSVHSDWVRFEAQKARALERELGRSVLCPLALDDAWKSCSWPGPLRQQIEDYYIIDFSEWRDGAAFLGQFARLIEGLGIHYPKGT